MKFKFFISINIIIFIFVAIATFPIVGFSSIQDEAEHIKINVSEYKTLIESFNNYISPINLQFNNLRSLCNKLNVDISDFNSICKDQIKNN